MKYVFMSVIMILWVIITLVATATVLGLLILAGATDWFDIPKQLIEKI